MKENDNDDDETKKQGKQRSHVLKELKLVTLPSG